MTSFRRTALAMVILASAALAAMGCRKSEGKDAKKAGADGNGPSLAWMGEKPTLDDVGNLLVEMDSGQPLLCWRAESALGEMGSSVAPRVRLALAASTPEARAAACRLAFKFRDQEAIPGMIALLGDDSRLVRNTANVFLCGLTDQDFGFRPDALESDRRDARKRWEAWYARTSGPVLPPKRK